MRLTVEQARALADRAMRAVGHDAGDLSLGESLVRCLERLSLIAALHDSGMIHGQIDMAGIARVYHHGINNPGGRSKALPGLAAVLGTPQAFGCPRIEDLRVCRV